MNHADINSFLYALYHDVSPIAVSIKCRKKHGIYTDKSLVYGESHLPSLHEIFNEINPQPGEIFYDFGAGSGRLLLFAALNFPFAKCIGVELLDDLVNMAQTKLALCQKKLANLPNFVANNMGEIKFVHADFTKVDVSDADVIYIASTCFTNKFMHSLALFLEKQLVSGSRVITFTKSLPSKKFRVSKRQFYLMEWGQTTVIFHEKI